jgi:hypothetical protein
MEEGESSQGGAVRDGNKGSKLSEKQEGGGRQISLKRRSWGEAKGKKRRRIPHQLDTRRVDLHFTMMRQLTTMFAKMGNLGGGTDVTQQPL